MWVRRVRLLGLCCVMYLYVTLRNAARPDPSGIGMIESLIALRGVVHSGLRLRATPERSPAMNPFHLPALTERLT